MGSQTMRHFTTTDDNLVSRPKLQDRYTFTGRKRVNEVLKSEESEVVGQVLTVCGWARTIRHAGKGTFSFLEINDGSTVENVQVIIDQNVHGFEELKQEGVGTSFKITGTLVKSPKKGQKYELVLNDNDEHNFKIFGSSPQSDYPLAKKKHSLEYLRDIQHLRPRSNTIGVVSRIRNTI